MSSASRSPRPLRVAVAGLGFGYAVHLPSWLGQTGIEVVGIASRRRDKATELASRHGISVATDDITELLSLEPDIFSLALPPDVAAAAARQALERGVAIISEKPIAGTFNEAAALAALAGNRTTAVNFSFSELDTFQTLRRHLASNEFGAPISADLTWRTESYAHKHRIWSWKTDLQRFGGVITSFASHVTHLVEWLLGPVRMLEASLDDRRTRAFAPPGTKPAWDQAEILLHHHNNAVFRAVLDNAAPGEDVHEWNIRCAAGSYRLVKHGPGIMTGLVLYRIGPDGTEEVVTQDRHQDSAGGRVLPFRRLLDRFVGAVRAEGTCEPSFAHGCRVQYLMAKIEASASATSALACDDVVLSA